jgi:hypothetical protein
VLGGIALVVAAFTVRLYAGDPADGGTLIAMNGTGVLIPVCVPLALSLIVFAGLHARCTRGSVTGERGAIVALSLLVAFTVISGFSIGLLVLPITALVATAVVLTPEP